MKKAEMKLHFEGANGTVTGSCTRLVHSFNGRTVQILVDCGLSQDCEEGKCKVPEWSFNPAEIHCVLLTHAHIDHCGGIPLLYKMGFTGKVYATEATVELAKVMLKDAANGTKLYDEEDVKKINWACIDKIEYKGKRGKCDTFFPIAMVSRLGEKIIAIGAHFIRTSHILGSSSVYVQWLKEVPETDEEAKSALDKKNFKNRCTILFSGDIGRTFDEINPESTFLKPNMFPYKDNLNILVLESTYGNRLHKSGTKYRQKLDKLESVLKRSLAEKKEGYLVVPAFALDRTQTVLMDLHDVLMSRRIFQDTAPSKNKCIIHSISKLGNDVSKIYARFFNPYSEKMMDHKGKIKYRYLDVKYDSTSDSNIEARISSLKYDDRHFNGENEFHVVNEDHYDGLSSLLNPLQITIGASGMCDKGGIKLVVENALRDERATIMLTGYTPENSAGGILKRFANDKTGGFTEIELFNKSVPGMNVRLGDIRAEIVDMSDYYSAHADAHELETYVFENPNPACKRVEPVQIMLNHGSIGGGLVLSERLDSINEKLGEAPKTIITSRFCRSFDISSGKASWIDSDDDKSAHKNLLEHTKEKLQKIESDKHTEDKPIPEMKLEKDIKSA